MGLTSFEVNIKEQAKKRNNAYFLLVDGMSKLMTQKVKECDSLDFYAYGLKWNLNISSDDAKDCISIFLTLTDEQCTGSNWEVNCRCRLDVVNQTGSPNIRKPKKYCFDSEDNSWGLDISHEELMEECLVDDKAVFYAEIIGVTSEFLNVTDTPPTIGTAERLTLMEVPRNKSRFTWKITKFSSFDREKHSSYEFTVGPRRWYLEMYPKGFSEGKGNSLSLFLHASDFVSTVPVKATSAIYKLRVLDQLKRCHREIETQDCFTSNSGGCGFAEFMSLEELHKASNGFLVNDEIYIGVEFLFVSPHEDL